MGHFIEIFWRKRQLPIFSYKVTMTKKCAEYRIVTKSQTKIHILRNKIPLHAFKAMPFLNIISLILSLIAHVNKLRVTKAKVGASYNSIWTSAHARNY